MSGSAMPMRRFLCPIILVLLFAIPSFAATVTLILHNGKIWTENPDLKEVEAVAIQGDRIVAVGTNAAILQLKQAETRLLDLEGRRVLPGFNDAHVHFYSGGASLAGPQLRYDKEPGRVSRHAGGVCATATSRTLDHGRQLGSRELDARCAAHPGADRLCDSAIIRCSSTGLTATWRSRIPWL